MTREEKLAAIQERVRRDNISLRSIQRGTFLSINTVRAAIDGDASTTDSTINYLFLYLGLRLESDKTEHVFEQVPA